MFDTALWLFLGLVLLFIWRGICWWECCGNFLRYFNYLTLLLVLIFVILSYDVYEFAMTFSGAASTHLENIPGWLRNMVYASPCVVWLCFALGAYQVLEHIKCIQEEPKARLRHDRAVQIIVLPVVYSAMCFSCLVKCCAFIVADASTLAKALPASTLADQLPLATAKAETCYRIGNLYESWALYQFGLLSLEVMESSLKRQSHSHNQDERSEARALLVAHKAVARLAWLGILSFVLVSVADSAVALWYLTIGTNRAMPHILQQFQSAESNFTVAGFLASCAAIFNVYIVEEQFHHFLQDFHPFLKFLTVKILVTFAYGQQYIFICLQALTEMAPKNVQDTIHNIPALGSIVKFNNLEFYIFYSALLIVECLFISLLHMWAWQSTEAWYEIEEAEAEDKFSNDEKALLPGAGSLYGSTAA